MLLSQKSYRSVAEFNLFFRFCLLIIIAQRSIISSLNIKWIRVSSHLTQKHRLQNISGPLLKCLEFLYNRQQEMESWQAQRQSLLQCEINLDNRFVGLNIATTVLSDIVFCQDKSIMVFHFLAFKQHEVGTKHSSCKVPQPKVTANYSIYIYCHFLYIQRRKTNISVLHTKVLITHLCLLLCECFKF